MTVRELIAELEKQPSDHRVMIWEHGLEMSIAEVLTVGLTTAEGETCVHLSEFSDDSDVPL